MSNVDDFALTREFLEKHLGTQDEASFSTYVRPVVLDDDVVAYGVYSDDGIQLAVFSTEEAAYYSARLNHLEPMLVH